MIAYTDSDALSGLLGKDAAERLQSERNLMSGGGAA
jgi:hypothetical protein